MSISWCKSLRWLPTPANKYWLTTLCLTLPESHLFADLRVLHSRLDLETPLYWAFAGYSFHDGDTCKFTHLIDSRGRTDVLDMGKSEKLPDGTVRETGRMRNFETGRNEDYEEIWTDEKAEEWVGLVRIEGEDEGVMVRVGNYWQGMMIHNGYFEAARWRLTGPWDKGVWHAEKPKWFFQWGPMDAWENGKVPNVEGKKVGDVIEYAQHQWRVVEINGL